MFLYSAFTETTGEILSRKTSFAGTVTAVSGQTGGAFVPGTDGKVTVDLGEGRSAQIFIKKNLYTDKQLEEYTEAFKKDQYVSVTGMLSYYNNQTTYGGAYDPASFQIVIPHVVSIGKYTAVDFAGDFLDTTDGICSASGNDHLTALQGVWGDLEASYNLLDDAEQAALASKTTTDETIKACIARYKYICGKYNKEGAVALNEFIKDVEVPHNAVFTSYANTNNNKAILATVVAVSIVSVSLLGVTLFIKKRKVNH